jgi:gag-polyprotein putative aspartyl protease
MTVLLLLISPALYGVEPGTHVPLHSVGTATYYVGGDIEGYGSTQLLIDTGSSYSTISEQTLDILVAKGTARYVKTLQGTLANGKVMTVPVYLVSGINIGGNCFIREIEVAVFPARMRPVLGLSALRKVAPFVFSLNPPNLALSHCDTPSGPTRKAGKEMVSEAPSGGGARTAAFLR